MSPPPPVDEGAAGASSRWFLQGFAASFSVPGFVLFATFIGYGGLLRDIGFPIGAGVVSTFLVWALPAQVILVGGLAAGSPLPALAIAVCLSGVRLLPMVVSILPLLKGERPRLWREILCAHFVAVTMWVEGLRLLPPLPLHGRPAFGIGLGVGLTLTSMIATLAGFYLADALPAPLAIALLLLTPISFAILLVRNARGATDWLAISLGAVIAPFGIYLPGGLDLFWAGIGGGTIAFLIGCRLDGRRRPS